MSDEQNKDSLLVDQKDALDFYFDALLLPDEDDFLIANDDMGEQNDAEISTVHTSEKSFTTEVESIEKPDKLQSAKDFLQASKNRQGLATENQAFQIEKSTPTPIPIPEQDSEITQTVELQTIDKSVEQAQESVTEQFINEQSISEECEKEIEVETAVEAEVESAVEVKPSKKVKTVISAGPVSPKPRLKESFPDEPLQISSKSLSSNIVFSTKKDDGEVNEQVLIPRSQKLAEANKMNPAQSVAKVISQADTTHTKAAETETLLQHSSIDEIKSPIVEKQPTDSAVLISEAVKPSEKSKLVSKEVSTQPQEAPNIDLSFFLPKIKTLSEEEIAQQIEALTQAAVSQAQMESELAHVAELEQVSQKLLKTQSEAASGEAPQNIDNAPSWAVPDFQVLLFTVAGLKLAVPLTELNGIVEWGDEYITELPGHKSWYLGIIQNLGKNVPVIDTLQQVVPQNRWPENHLSDRNFKHIIMIDNSCWGLACETVLEVVTLKTDAVKWRSSRTKRRWLLGTVIDHMCALLDSAEFAAMLKTGDDSLIS